jgi:DNA (cytosine-5)-methyltransferase 1
MRVLDLFSGIGGFAYAGQLLGGFTTIDFVELDSYCQQVLRKNFPNVPIHDDINTFDTSFRFGDYDLITAGFPCQDLSSAGKQAGLGAGTRSGLFYRVMQIARQVRPKYILLENVANTISHANGQSFQQILYEIAKSGYNAEWGIVSARDVGGCHLRKRIWIIAYANDPRYYRTSKCQANSKWTETISEGYKSQPQPTRQADAVANTQSIRVEGNRHTGQQEQLTLGKTGLLDWSDTGIRLSSDWRTFASQPMLRRGDDGLSRRVDRLKCLGNTICPQTATIPLNRIKELDALFQYS